MKSQDILVLLKLVSLHQRMQADLAYSPAPKLPMDWMGWTLDGDDESHELSSAGRYFTEQFTTRGLEAALGLGKSEVSKSLARCIDVGLAIKDRKTGYPKTNTGVLLEFIAHGLRYVFPARPGAMVRGIPTGAAAPVLRGELLGAGQFIWVWPDPMGNQMGQEVSPLYRSVPYAVRRDGCFTRCWR